MTFLRKSLESLLNDKELRKHSHQELRLACEEALETLKKSEEKNNETSKTDDNHVLPEPNLGGDVSIDRVFRPFELACQSKIPRIVVFSLDTIQKLVAYGHIRKDVDSKSGVRGKDEDDGTSSASSASAVAQGDKFYDHLTDTVSNCFVGPQTDDGIQLQVLKALLTIVTSNNVQVHENSLLLAVRTCYNIFLASKNLINQTTAKATLNQMLNNIFFKMESFSSSSSLDSDSVKVVYPLVVDMCENAMEEVTLQSSSSDKVIRDSDNVNNNKQQFNNVLEKDCFLVFRSLCKLSAKPLPQDGSGVVDPKSHELRSKILSLQLLLSILQNGGETFIRGQIFISAMKQYLCVALSMNGVSAISEVFELSLALFISLLTKYRKYLKSQIEIFFKEICLNILEATSSSFDQKWMVIQGICKICEDPQIVVDIFVNYDCDLAAANIFERLVDDLSKIAQGRQSSDIGASHHQLKRYRIKGLECLVSILKCMVEWSKELYINPHIDAAADLQRDVVKDFEDADDPSQFEKVKQHKGVLEQAIRLFNQKPTKGIKCLLDRQICQDNSASIASFFHAENNRINKTTLGEFLGELNNKEIMYDYVDLMDFSGMNFVKALRHFLEGFRLPGEAQKIDRLMEKFASRYFHCNPGQDLFASADTAYVLAYSIIMLTTDLHSSQVKKKMTKEEFIRNNRGINDSEDLPENYLSKIYEEIALSEIKMKSDTSHVSKVGFVSDQKKRHQIWTMESETISQTAGALMESASSKSDVFTTARSYEHVKPMFKLVWSPVLAAFSVGLQDCHDSEVSQLCLGGMQCAIRIACIFGFSLERNAFVQALARFTLLTDNANVSEIKTKNIDAIKTLISIAHSDGNYLSSSWFDILKCISQLELAQTVGTNSLAKEGGNSAGNSNSSSSIGISSFYTSLSASTSMSNGSIGGSGNNVHMGLSVKSSSSSNSIYDGSSGMLNGTPDSLSEASSQSVLVAVDRIFTGSKNLNGDAIVDFVSALCVVSRDEITSETVAPRMFSLIKLVEISYYNMNRIRLQWSRIWAVLGNHFNVVGCNETPDISFFAVDSLKQLSLKFLEKGELDNFHFQKDFLRPFEFIMKNNKSNQIRDMVVRCIAQMVQSQAKNIKSGWKNIFATYTLAAGDDDNSVVTLSFHSTANIASSMLDEAPGSSTVVDFFQDCIKCLSEFACNHLYPDISMEAIRLIRKCANFIAERKFLSVEDKDDKDRVWIRGWFPVLFELSCIMNRSKLDIRTRSLTILFDIVKNYGSLFERHWWLDLFKVIFRIFDVAKLNDDDKKISDDYDEQRISHHREWIDTTCNHALYAMTDVFNEFFTDLSSILLVDLLAQYKWCIRQENDQLSKSAISCFKNLVITNEQDLDSESERLVLKFLSDIVLCTYADQNRDRSSQHRIFIHLEVISTVKKIVFMRFDSRTSTLSDDEAQCYLSIVESLITAHDTAKVIIGKVEETTMLPVLTKYETNSLLCCLEILFKFYSKGTLNVEAKLLEVLNSSFAYYLSMTSKLQRDEWNALLLIAFTNLLTIETEKFLILIPVLYNHICDILSSQISIELKNVICDLLKRVGVVYKIVKIV